MAKRVTGSGGHASPQFVYKFNETFLRQRPPAVPLVAHNPYFGIWSIADHLTDAPTEHWTGAPLPIEGIARIDGKAYRFMGRHPESLPAMPQTSNTIMPTQTLYEFSEAGVQPKLEFFTPAIMSDLDLLSCPVTYLTWRVQSTDGSPLTFQSCSMWIQSPP